MPLRDGTICPLCEGPATSAGLISSNSCKHGVHESAADDLFGFSAVVCYRCHPEKCPHLDLGIHMESEPTLPPVAEVASEDPNAFPPPIDYNGQRYVRSEVMYARTNLVEYMADRRLVIPGSIKALIDHMPGGTFIAGGSVAELACAAEFSPKDVDLYFRDEETYKQAVKLLGFAGKEVEGPQVPGGVRMFTGPHGSAPIQAINIAWYDDLEQVLDAFDFTVCQFGLDCQTGTLMWNPVAPLDYMHRRLVTHRDEDRERTKKRITRYIAKGFNPVGETLARAMALGVIPYPVQSKPSTNFLE